MWCWPHSGFSVGHRAYLAPHRISPVPADPQFIPDPEFLESEYREYQGETTREL